jgi:GNAT superfamily N-acetyltransferase
MAQRRRGHSHLITRFEPQTASRREWDRYHRFRRLRHQEDDPDDPYTPDALLEELWKRDDPYQETRRWVFSSGDEVVAEFGISRTLPASPEYESWKSILWVGAGVLEGHRRRGIASGFLPLALEVADEVGAIVLSGGTHETDGQAFARWLGAEPRFSGANNRLDLEAVGWDMVREWVAAGERRSPQTKLELYEPRIPDSAMAAWCTAYTAMLNTVPWEDMDHGDAVVTPETMRNRYEKMERSKSVHHALVAREPDGSISGLTEMRYVPYAPTSIEQDLTAVLPAARGRGLGKWLKAALLLHARELYPDVRWVRTDNAGSNAPMLAINHQLGFKKHREGTAYQMTREELAARLAALGVHA